VHGVVFSEFTMLLVTAGESHSSYPQRLSFVGPANLELLQKTETDELQYFIWNSELSVTARMCGSTNCKCLHSRVLPKNKVG